MSSFLSNFRILYVSYRKVDKSPCGHAKVLLTSDRKQVTRLFVCVRVDFQCRVIFTCLRTSILWAYIK